MKSSYLKKMTILFAAVGLLMAAGCGQAEENEAQTDGFNTETEVLAQAEAPAEEPEAEEPVEETAGDGPTIDRQIVDGKIRSWFTGEWVDTEIGLKRPLAIMLNNTSAALPMSGVSSAAVLYECPVEGRITRWMGVFEDWENLERIGSVRSCRLYYLHLSQEFDPIYAHFGQAQYALEALNSGQFDVLSGGTKGIKNPATAMYDRISRPGKATEHTLYAFPKGIKKDIEKKGYDMTMPEDYQGKFKFADTDTIAEYEGYPDATVLKPGGDGGKNGFGGVKATFKYNASDRKYYRWTYGNPHTDELNGKQVAVTNVIFQYCDGNVLDAKDYLHFATQSNGNPCKVFTNGKEIDGTWRNPGELGTPARYYDENGQEIVLNNGKTFVCIIWNDYKDDVVIQ